MTQDEYAAAVDFYLESQLDHHVHGEELWSVREIQEIEELYGVAYG